MSDLTASMIRAIGDGIAPRGKGNGRLCIVNYHRILNVPDPLLESEPDILTFRRQMELLADCFNALPLHEALDALANRRMPPRAVCITFDDGYRSTYDLALPILEEFKLPATVFVTSGQMGECNMWNDRILEALRVMPTGTLDLRLSGPGVYQIDTLEDRSRAIADLTEKAKYFPPPQRQALIDQLEALAGVYEPGLMLTPAMVRTLAERGMEIGAHTISHPILTSLEDASAMVEIAESKRQLEAVTGKPVRFFAYPNGKVGMDFDERHVTMARKAGFEAAFTTAIGSVNSGHDLFALPRSRPWDTTPLMYVLRLLRWLAR